MFFAGKCRCAVFLISETETETDTDVEPNKLDINTLTGEERVPVREQTKWEK